MPESRSAILQVEGEGDIRVSETAKFLSALENAYNGILVLFKTIEMLPKLDRELDFPLYPLMAFWPSVPIASRRGKLRPLDSASIAAAVNRREALIVKSVRLESPGHWNFMGVADSLEVIRKFLNDRHERKKDRAYREAKEKERLSLENELLRTKAVSERLELARQMGIPNDYLVPLVERLLYEPLDELSKFQDRGVIDDAKLLDENSETSKENPPELPTGRRKITL